MNARGGYVGRFAPSPSGPLHAGSLAAALASYLDAKAHGGAWLVRIEDIDPPRELAGAARDILASLDALGMRGDGQTMFQSARGAAYQAAFERLQAMGHTYPCACTRSEIADSRLARGRALGPVYPGTCRRGLAPGRAARSWRFLVEAGVVGFDDRLAGRVEQDVASEVGDFVLKRADGLWAYQLAVVVDDAAQGVTDVVRGADLLESTPRQIALQRALGLPGPRYLHVPAVLAADGQKLSKQTGAAALDLSRATDELMAAWVNLGFDRFAAASVAAFWQEATARWARRFRIS